MILVGIGRGRIILMIARVRVTTPLTSTTHRIRSITSMVGVRVHTGVGIVGVMGRVINSVIIAAEVTISTTSIYRAVTSPTTIAIIGTNIVAKASAIICTIPLTSKSTNTIATTIARTIVVIGRWLAMAVSMAIA